MLQALIDAMRSIIASIRGAAKKEDDAKAKANRDEAEREVTAAEEAAKERKP
jgi:hypothetical protein